MTNSILFDADCEKFLSGFNSYREVGYIFTGFSVSDHSIAARYVGKRLSASDGQARQTRSLNFFGAHFCVKSRKKETFYNLHKSTPESKASSQRQAYWLRSYFSRHSDSVITS